MNNPSNIPPKYHSKWQIPKLDDNRNVIGYDECFGILTYDGNKCILEVFHDFRVNAISKMNEHFEVIYGSNDGKLYTLFNVYASGCDNYIKMTYVADYAVIGHHIESTHKSLFNKCVVKYPYLRNWVHRSLMSYDDSDNIKLEINKGQIEPLFEIEVKSGVKIKAMPHYNLKFHSMGCEMSYIEDTFLEIESREPLSFNTIKSIYTQFTLFLSIALYGRQNPNSVKLYIDNGTENAKTLELLFSVEESEPPFVIPLMKYNILKDRLNVLVKNWYSEQYEQFAPIGNYLIRAIKNSVYDVQKFLMVAQGLDGYHKRFINKANGKDIRKYKERIDALLEVFKDVSVLQKCNINSTIVAHTRDKFSHLIPDDDNGDNIREAVEGYDLYILTKKVIILLTCCVLDYIGLTAEEINKCIVNSKVEQMLYRILDAEKNKN